ncbi:MFS transporter [Acetobacter sacchari]|uniref:MFS transporter n=1 Tax=Acetobacter sacchari TaxID=2661687 RepID=A0ABS3M028_9PROT|nr:MFS transporter [Acetobacter sacchari]MBO1361490.1 MFS transporter [Acetobacter sacchari]
MTITTALTNDDALQRGALYRRVAFRIIPILAICYLIAMIDRANVGYAKLQLLSDLGFSEAAYGFGAGVFFVGYILFEVPSNIWLHRTGVRRTLLRIMTFWGVVTMATALVKTPLQFYVARFLLGAAEGGFFPGLLLYLTYWFPGDRKAKAYALCMLANPASGIVGGLLAGGFMSHAEMLGLRGWQILFIVGGAMAVIAGVVAFFSLADSPRTASWLKAEERDYIIHEVSRSRASATNSVRAAPHKSVWTDPRVYMAALAYFTLMSSVSVLSLWGPSIIRSLGVQNAGTVGFVSIIQYLVGGVGMYLTGASSDFRRERAWHYVVCAGLISTGAFLLAFVHLSAALSILFLSMIAFGIYGGYAVFFTIPGEFLEPDDAPAGLAMVTMIGGLGGFVTPSVLGVIKSATGSLDYGVAFAALLAFLGGLIVAFRFAQWPGQKAATHDRRLSTEA